MVDYLEKPRSYTHIKRNVYLTKKRKRRSVDEDPDGMQCSCKLACGKDCLCAMLNYICSSTCRCAKSCLNKPLHQRPFKKLRLSETEKCGWGVKAGEDIKAGEFLIGYVGEVIDHKTCQERVLKMEEKGETNFYLCEISRDMVIDATYRGNMSRFINHSCRPNSVLQKWEDDGETTTGLFAKTDIQKGEFVTYDYQFIQFGRDEVCYCGAADCRGFLGAKPKPKPKPSRHIKFCSSNLINYGVVKGSVIPKCIGVRVRVWWPLDEMFYSGSIVNYDAGSDEHTVVYDDGEAEKLVMLNEKWEFDRKHDEMGLHYSSVDSRDCQQPNE